MEFESFKIAVLDGKNDYLKGPYRDKKLLEIYKKFRIGKMPKSIAKPITDALHETYKLGYDDGEAEGYYSCSM